MADTGARRARPLLISNHPLYQIFLPIPIICFVGAVLTDLTYLSHPDMMWIDFSSWLLLAGLIGGAIAGIILVIELVRMGRDRPSALTIHFLLLLAAWIVAVFNSFVHTRDGWTAVAGTGLILSILGAVLALVAGWFWRSAVAETVVGDAS